MDANKICLKNFKTKCFKVDLQSEILTDNSMGSRQIYYFLHYDQMKPFNDQMESLYHIIESLYDNYIEQISIIS